jgi:hypothetical protein
MDNKKYCPSNGTEGMAFIEHYCERCINQHPDPNNKKQCMILCHTMCYSVNDEKYPKEWIYDDNGKPTCTAFVKWDWDNDGDPDDPDNPKAPIPYNPNQLLLPFIFDELNIPKSKPEFI